MKASIFSPRTLQNRLMQRQRTSAHLCRWSGGICLRQRTPNTQHTNTMSTFLHGESECEFTAGVDFHQEWQKLWFLAARKAACLIVSRLSRHSLKCHSSQSYVNKKHIQKLQKNLCGPDRDTRLLFFVFSFLLKTETKYYNNNIVVVYILHRVPPQKSSPLLVKPDSRLTFAANTSVLL